LGSNRKKAHIGRYSDWLQSGNAKKLLNSKRFNKYMAYSVDTSSDLMITLAEAVYKVSFRSSSRKLSIK